MPKPASTRYVTVHGHFYQPPRENPWLEMVEVQDSAAPFHDWNQRITFECYATNGAARLLNENRQIARIVNNYARTSFNFGPTLLSWLEEHAPRVYRCIQEADREGAERFSGHGPAMAQVYNHIILPLATERDRITQIRWGIADFEYRFGRKPEGMWLAETAADTHSLDLLAREGIRFVVLAPAQCRHVRNIVPGGRARPWHTVNTSTLDTRVSYRIPLPGGRSIAAFFYDGNISQAVAFEGLLTSGDRFAARLLSGFIPSHDGQPQLVHIATDGESYGHHHRHGEMALAYALHRIERDSDARLTIYGEYLDIAPPRHEAEVHDNSAWSCSHGVERWRSDCGCSSNRPGWNQRWRTPLREALDQLRDGVQALAVPFAASLLRDYDAARDAYISVILDRSPESVDGFLHGHALNPRDEAAQVAILRLMELERNALLMYTSCGWFFDDISGIETVQILAYASRVLELSAILFGAPGAALEAPFLARLEHAHSNVPAQRNGAAVFRKLVKPQAITLEQAAAHHLIRSLFPGKRKTPADAFTLQLLENDIHARGSSRLAVGRATVRSRLTREAETFHYALLHYADQDLTAALRPCIPGDEEHFRAFAVTAWQRFNQGDLEGTAREIAQVFGKPGYSLHSLFVDEQRRILDLVTERTVQEVEVALRAIHNEHTSILHFLSEGGMPQPAALHVLSEFVTGTSFFHAIARPRVTPGEVADLLDRLRGSRIPLDTAKLVFTVADRSKRELIGVQRALSPDNSVSSAIETIASAVQTIDALRLVPVELNLWQAQNIWNESRTAAAMLFRDTPEGNAMFAALGRLLDFDVDHLPPVRLPAMRASAPQAELAAAR